MQFIPNDLLIYWHASGGNMEYNIVYTIDNII